MILKPVQFIIDSNISDGTDTTVGSGSYVIMFREELSRTKDRHVGLLLISVIGLTFTWLQEYTLKIFEHVNQWKNKDI